ncbi:MAG: 3'(2'),5'-bisphosphate nucleotidase CysQ, partial [Candidatus Promineifilaceae bacterium]|nr:3'(2'),5'-bisphosphate nucleotidase CysQ [Candidatus Promineifilaceae bacterium]
MSSTPSVSADLLDDAVAATIQAGAAIMDYFRDSFSVHDKSPDNPVTDADLAADKLLRQQLGRVMPSAGWLSEETVDNADRLDREWVWVVDPLDGTKEFVMGIPEFTVSVGLVKAGHPVLGVILNPARGELYYGRQGNGVAFQRQPVSASQRSELTGALVDASRSERTRGDFAPFEVLVTVRTVGS